MRFSRCLVAAGLAGLVWSMPKKSAKAKPEPDLLDVKLTPQGGSVIKVSIKNLGKKKLDLFQRGTILGQHRQKDAAHCIH
jgi:hypothetical protein